MQNEILARLSQLTERLDMQERHAAPSMVPSVHDVLSRWDGAGPPLPHNPNASVSFSQTQYQAPTSYHPMMPYTPAPYQPYQSHAVGQSTIRM